MTELTFEALAAAWIGGIVLFLDCVAVGLRIAARKTKNAQLGWDDWFIILAIPLEFAYVCILLWGIIVGADGGRPLTELNLGQLEVFFKSEYIADFFINTICTVVKFSILFFYDRIFKVEDSFRTASRIIGTLCFTWYIVSMCFATIPCQPISAAWIIGLEGPYPLSHCINFPIYFVCIEANNVALDIAILCLPITSIWSLHLPSRQKFSLVFIFLLGGFVVICGLLRIIVSYTTLSLFILDHFSILETGVSIICACLPTLGPLLTNRSQIFDRFKSWYSSRALRSTNNSSQFDMMTDPLATNNHYADVSGARSASQASSKDYPLGVIAVKASVHQCTMSRTEDDGGLRHCTKNIC